MPQILRWFPGKSGARGLAARALAPLDIPPSPPNETISKFVFLTREPPEDLGRIGGIRSHLVSSKSVVIGPIFDRLAGNLHFFLGFLGRGPEKILRPGPAKSHCLAALPRQGGKANRLGNGGINDFPGNRFPHFFVRVCCPSTAPGPQPSSKHHLFHVFRPQTIKPN